MLTAHEIIDELRRDDLKAQAHRAATTRKGPVPEAPPLIVAHALDVISYVLDERNSPAWFQAMPETHIDHWRIKARRELSEAMAQRTPDAPADPGDTYRRVKRSRRTYSERGSLDVSRYLEHNRTPFEDRTRTTRRADAVNVIINSQIPHTLDPSQTGNAWECHHMHNAFKVAHRLAWDAEQEQRPCRISLLNPLRIEDMPSHKDGKPVQGIVAWMLVIKDWQEPIFAGAWQAIASNTAVNRLSVLIANSLTGTQHHGHGKPIGVDINEDLIPDLCDATLIKAGMGSCTAPPHIHTITAPATAQED